jgi:hypothetical protein
VGFWEHFELPALVAMPAELVGCLFFAYILGGNAVGAMLDGNGRRTRVGYALTALSVALGLYVSWWGWLVSLPDRHFSAIALLNPVAMVRWTAVNARDGLWLENWDFHTVPLCAVWLAEAGLIVAIAFGVARRRLGEKVFCDRCLAWCEGPRHVMQFEAAAAEQLRDDLLAGRSPGLARLERSKSGAREWCELYLEVCPKCTEMRALTLTRAAFIKDAGANLKRETLLRRLLLTPAQGAEIVAASMKG